MQTRVLFYVQHLLGIGHLVRAGRVAAALSEAFEVLLVVGGELPAGLLPDNVSLFALPPVKAGPSGFSALVHPDGRPFTAEDKADRRDLLLGCFDEFFPEVVLIEAFPFGRRAMRFELLPLLERAAAAAQRPLVACSVRDILQDARPERRAETVALIRRHFDLVLVHGDPRLVHLSDSFPEAQQFADLIGYTGMVGPRHDGLLHGVDHAEDERFDVVVSVGGGAVGARLVAAALAARPLSQLADARWLVLTGPNADAVPEAPAAHGVSVRYFVPDLAARLARARVSVSQAGYNTVADLVAARCRAVLVPYAAGGETEQARRAALLAERGLAVVVEEKALDAATLAAAVDAALDLPPPEVELSLDGADLSRILIERHLGGA
ncbi:glycosyltransferase family protein [Lichenibacterium dinghuense]|uniref:glycosyltransferase family protein n=1 Tax=Lichenibacterium dinghuense TaxID=2895977 RepID=UPI001F44934C|nr:glycosyltransferase [Lichenibacterium sp. 6Y81]